MRRSTWWLMIVACAVLLPQAWAEEDAEKAAREAEKKAKRAVSRFRSEFRTKSLRKRNNALLILSNVQHELTVAEFRKVIKKAKQMEILEACYMVLGDMSKVADSAGAVLKENVRRHKKEMELIESIALSIGRLRFKGAHDELLWMLDHKEQRVLIAAIRTIGDVKDAKALPKLYDLAKYQGTGFSWSTGEVRVDTGTSGDADQRAAEAAWHAKYGHVKPRAPINVVKTYMRHLREAVEKITGQKFKSLAEFKAWIDAHPVEVGLKPPPRPKR